MDGACYQSRSNDSLKGVLLRGLVTDHIQQLGAIKSPTFVDAFSDTYTRQVAVEPVDMADVFAKQSVWDAWGTDAFDRMITHDFLDAVDENHPLVKRLVSDAPGLLADITTAEDMIRTFHRTFVELGNAHGIHARTLTNLTVSYIRAAAKSANMMLPNIHSYDAIDAFNHAQIGLCWEHKNGWQALGHAADVPLAFNMDALVSCECDGGETDWLSKNGPRPIGGRQVVDKDHALVNQMAAGLFPSWDGLGVMDVIQTIRQHMRRYDYVADDVHEWQNLDTILARGGGDCEDLAHLEASLLLRALGDAGFQDIADTLTFVTGMMGASDYPIGHTVMQLTIDGRTFIIDSTSNAPMMEQRAYQSITGFVAGATYTPWSSKAELQRARAIETAADISSYVSGKSAEQVRDQFLQDLGMTSYFNSATAYYEAVTDKSINAAFWGLTDPNAGSTIAAENATKEEILEPIRFGPTSFAGETETSFRSIAPGASFFDSTRVEALFDEVENNLEDMEVNLTSTSMNAYVGQQYSGYYVYDYSRIMADYEGILNTIQTLTVYLSAIAVISNALNWVGAQLTYENEPNAEIGSVVFDEKNR